METWQWLITSVLGLSFLGDIVLRSRRRKNNAEAEHAQHDADKAEVERLHMQIEHQQKSLDTYLKIEKDLSERISEQNKALNEKEEQIRDKTGQIRKLTAQLIDSEHGRNADKDEIARLAAENGYLNTLVEYLKQWRCERTDCKDERGRKPPNQKLTGLKYEPPKRAVK